MPSTGSMHAPRLLACDIAVATIQYVQAPCQRVERDEMDQSADVIIIGAGHNGLVAGCYLAQAGVDVLVLERSPRVGGMMATNATIPAAPEHRINEGAMDVSMFRAASIASDLELTRFGFQQRVVDPAYAFLEAEGA